MVTATMQHPRYKPLVASGSSRKATFRLDEAILEAMRSLVDAGAAESQTAFVEAAICERLRVMRKRELENAYATAAEDPAFMADMQETTTAFEGTAADGLGAL